MSTESILGRSCSAMKSSTRLRRARPDLLVVPPDPVEKRLREQTRAVSTWMESALDRVVPHSSMANRIHFAAKCSRERAARPLVLSATSRNLVSSLMFSGSARLGLAARVRSTSQCAIECSSLHPHFSRQGVWSGKTRVAWLLISGSGVASAQDTPPEILAAQLRLQRHRCDTPVTAQRDTQLSNPDEAAWILKARHHIPPRALRPRRGGAHRAA
jgi:hypothetical protein